MCLGCFGEFFVFEVFRANKLHHGIAEEIRILSIVEAPCHLLQVGWKMFNRNLMPRSYNAALKEAEGRLNRVGRDAHSLFVAYVFISVMVDGLVLAAILRRVEVVNLRFVGHDDIHGLVHIASNDVVNGFLVHMVNRDEVQMPFTLSDADYWRVLLPLFRVLGFAADIHLINFDRSTEFVICFGHGSAYAMAQIPRGFVTDSECTLDLIRRHSLAALTEQVGAEKPLPQVQMGVVKDRRGSDRELVMA